MSRESKGETLLQSRGGEGSNGIGFLSSFVGVGLALSCLLSKLEIKAPRRHAAHPSFRSPCNSSDVFWTASEALCSKSSEQSALERARGTLSLGVVGVFLDSLQRATSFAPSSRPLPPLFFFFVFLT